MATAMTAQWVERIRELTKDREDHYDTKIAGLGLRVSRTGKKVWFVKYRMKGDPKNRRLTLEPYPQMSLADARQAAHDVILRAGRGEDPAGEKQEVKGSATVKALAAAYVERHAKVHKRSWLKDEQALAKDVYPAWGGRKACDIKRKDVIALVEAKAKAGSPIQANRLLALVRKMYNWGISVDLVESNPCLMVVKPAPERRRDRSLTETELKALWAAIESYGGVITPMFKLRLLTAQRGGEVATMRWEDVDLDAAWWTIPAERAKNKHSHRVPLSPPVVKILRELREKRDDKDGGWVFRGRRIGQPFKHFGEPTRVLRERSGVDFVPHDLRRTAGTMMAGLKIPRLTISKIMNHAEAGITGIYDRHSYDPEKREALDTWAKHLLKIVRHAELRVVS